MIEQIYYHIGDLPTEIYNEIEMSKVVACDTESLGLKPRRDRLAMVQLSTGNGVAHLVHILDNDYTKCVNLRRFLLNPNITKLFHFAKADLMTLMFHLDLLDTEKKTIDGLSNCYCTKLASYLARTYTRSHGLKELCRDLLGINLAKHQQSSNWGSHQLSKEQKEYAAKDVLHLHALVEKLNEILIQENRMELAQQCFKSMHLHAKLELLGWSSSVFDYNYEQN